MALADFRPLSVVLNDIVGNVQRIVRAEVRLAKVELREDAMAVRHAAIFMGAGGLIGVPAIAILLLAAVYALSTVVSQAMAALIVGAVAAALAGALAFAGVKHLTRVTLPPPKTSATLQETIQWAKTRAR